MASATDESGHDELTSENSTPDQRATVQLRMSGPSVGQGSLLLHDLRPGVGCRRLPRWSPGAGIKREQSPADLVSDLSQSRPFGNKLGGLSISLVRVSFSERLCLPTSASLSSRSVGLDVFPTARVSKDQGSVRRIVEGGTCRRFAPRRLARPSAGTYPAPDRSTRDDALDSSLCRTSIPKLPPHLGR